MKAILDKYLQSNYTEACKYASYFIARSKLPLNYAAVLSNSYIRYCTISPQITEEHQVKAYFFHIIKTEILWRDTDSRLEFVTAVDEDRQIVDYENTELEDKINTELNRQDQLKAINLYRENETDQVKRIFFETYYDKGYNTTRSIASHFDISTFTAHIMIRNMKDEIQDIYNQLKQDAN
jgi:hypothetical protein